MDREGQYRGSDQRPQTAFQSQRIQSGKIQLGNKFPNVDDKRTQSAGYKPSCQGSRSITQSAKQINPIYQELGFVAPQSAKSVNNPQKFQSTQGQEIMQKDYKRIIPRSMMQDKEQLYEELLKNKQLVNHLQEDNYKLRTKVAFQEEEIQKNGQVKQEYEDILTSSIHQSGNMQFSKSQTQLGQNQNQGELSIIPNLKKQVKDLTFELRQKEKELQAIKRNVKLTKLSELEVELKSYEDETIRLKHLLQQSLQIQNQNNDEEDNNMEERFIQQLNQNKGLQKQISQLEDQINLFQEQFQAQENKYKELERINYRLTKEKTKLKQQLVQKEKDLDRYRLQDPLAQQTVKSRNLLGTSEGQLKNELEKKILECNAAVSELTSIKKSYEDYKKKADLVDYEQQQTIKNQADKIQEQKEKIEVDAKAYAELKDKYEKIINISNKKERQTKERSQRNSNSQQPIVYDHKQQLLDVQNLVGYELKYKLQVQKIDPLTLNQFLFTQEALTTNIVSYKELFDKFQKEPFGINDGNKLVTLVKYLMIETDEPRAIDENSKSTMQIIKKNFLDVVLNYKKLRRDEEKAIIRQVYAIIKENKQRIKQQIENLQRSKYGNVDSLQCTRDTFLLALKNLGFEPNTQDFIMGKIYEETKNCESINIDFFFNLFSMENAPQIGRDSILARRQSQLYQKGVIAARPLNSPANSQFTPMKTGAGTNTNKNSNQSENFTKASQYQQQSNQNSNVKSEEQKQREIQKEKEKEEQKKKYEEEQEKQRKEQLQKIKEEEEKQKKEQEEKEKQQKEQEEKEKQLQQQKKEKEEQEKLQKEKEIQLQKQKEEEEKQKKQKEEEELQKQKQKEEEEIQKQKQQEQEQNNNNSNNQFTSDFQNQLQSKQSDDNENQQNFNNNNNQNNNNIEDDFKDNFQDDFETLNINEAQSQPIGQSVKDQILQEQQQQEIKEEEYEHSDDNNQKQENQQQQQDSSLKIEEDFGTSDLGTDPQYKQEKSKTKTQTNTNDKQQMIMEEVEEEPDVIEL